MAAWSQPLGGTCIVLLTTHLRYACNMGSCCMHTACRGQQLTMASTADVIEHIAWTGGSSHLRLDEQSWVVRHMVDVFAFLALVVTTVLAALTWAAVKLCKLLVRLLRRGATVSKKQV